MKTSILFATISFSLLAFIACNNTPDIEKLNRVAISDSNPVLDSISTDILKDPISATTITPVNNQPDNKK